MLLVESVESELHRQQPNANSDKNIDKINERGEEEDEERQVSSLMRE